MDEARRVVRPHVGELTKAFDSPADVYRVALDHMGVEHAAIKDAAALKVLVEQLGAAKTSSPRPMAADSASVKSFNEQFPDAARIRAA
jgi:hypothetical protein